MHPGRQRLCGKRGILGCISRCSCAHLLLPHTQHISEVTTQKMSITTASVDRCLDMLQQLAYKSSRDRYTKVFNDFMAAAPTSVAQYYNHNWHSIRKQWVRGLTSQHVNLANMTNNQLESINQKMITSNCTFASCVTSLKTAIHSLRTERDHRAVTVVQKRPVHAQKR